MRQEATILRDYSRDITSTDMLPLDNLHSVLQGLFGEVGSVMAVAKKHRREGKAYPEHQRAAEEEFGDVLWYFVTLCRRLCIDLDTVFPKFTDWNHGQCSKLSTGRSRTTESRQDGGGIARYW